MVPSESEYRRMLEGAYPPEVMKAFLLAIGSAYKSAVSHSKRNFDDPDVHDVLGHVRRAKIHEELRGVGERYGLAPKDEPNSSGSTFFLTIPSGGMRLVCCLTHAPTRMIRPARIRKMWARYNCEPQQTFSFIPEVEKPADALRLAVLLHGPKGRHRDEVGFCDIVLPNQHLTRYICRIPLFSEFQQTIEDNPKLFTPKRRRGFGTA